MLNSHVQFIKSQAKNILEEAVMSISCMNIENRMESYPLFDYILQSVFLRMTGFLEQKLKCICWELATDDYEYRYERFSKRRLGECSSLEEKTSVLNDIISQIKKIKGFTTVEKSKIINEASQSLSILEIIKYMNEYDYSLLIDFVKNFPESSFIKIGEKEKYDIFVDPLKKEYDCLYTHRNRCAHNLLSYQANLPDLKKLSDSEYIKPSYFKFFYILILIDELFICLWNEYENAATSRL